MQYSHYMRKFHHSIVYTYTLTHRTTMLGLILVLVLILIAYFAYQWWQTPRWRRAINMLTVLDGDTTQVWRVNPNINARPFFLQFSNFEGVNNGTLTMAKYDQDGSVIDAGKATWEGAGTELRIGTSAILLHGRNFTYVDRSNLQNQWQANMVPGNLPKKAVAVPK